MNIPVAILAGGLATRMRPLTNTIPKSLLPVAGRPFIDHQLCYLRQQEIQRVIICCGFMGEEIRNHVGDGSQFGLSIEYSPDGNTPLGTGGAIQNALPLLGESFFVLYGDSFLPIHFLSIAQSFLSDQYSGLMTILGQQYHQHCCNIEYHDGSIVQYDKINPSPHMNFIDYGLSILSNKSFDTFSGSYDLGAVFQRLVRQNKMQGLEVFQRFYEIGSVDGLEETSHYLMSHNCIS